MTKKTVREKKCCFSSLTTALILLLLSSSLLATSIIPSAEAQTTIPGNLLQYEWASNSADASRSYASTGPGPSAPHIEWKTEVPDAASPPVAFNGRIFLQDSPDYAPDRTTVISTYCLDAATGAILWKCPGLSGSILKLDNTYMMVGSNCYRIADGSLVWKGPTGFSYSQNAYMGIGYIDELNLFLVGSQAWTLTDPSQPPTILWDRANQPDYLAYGAESNKVYGNGVIMYNTAFNYIVGVDARTGKTLWAKPTHVTSWVYGASYIDGVFGFGALDGNFYGWNATNGEQMWVYNPGTYYNEFASASGAAYGMFFEHNQDTYVYAINASTGQLVWKAKGPGIAYSNTLSIAGGKVYVQMGENQYTDFATGAQGKSEFDCYNATTGELIWSMPFEAGAPFNCQCNAYGKLYVVPTITSNIPGFYEGRKSTGSVWCIGDQPQDWSMLLNDPVNSGFGEGPTNLALKWVATTGGGIVSSPTLYNGMAYVGSYDGNIYAFNANTGERVWNYSTDKVGFSSTLAVVGGKVYTGPDDGNIYCLDASTGTKQWSVSAGVAGTTSPTVANGMVYVPAGSNLLCLNADNGALAWNFSGLTATPPASAMVGSPVVFDGAVYISASGIPGQTGFHVFKVNATTGTQIYNIILNGYAGGASYPEFYTVAPVTLGGGMVFARAANRYNYAINATTGATVWFKDARYNPGTPGQSNGVTQAASMLYANGLVYMSDFYGVDCLNATTGNETWVTYTSRENLAPGLSYSPGRVYTVNEAGILNVLDAVTGTQLSFWQFGGVTLHSTPTPYNGSLYVSTLDWNLYCFEEAPAAQITGPTTATATTVTATPNSQTFGSQVTFSGTVTAQSTGVPVTVHLTALDPNNNYQNIANATCDESGFFTAKWAPPVSGTYVVTAKFDGDLYFSASSAKTTFIVTEAASTSASASVDEIVQKVLTGLQGFPEGVSADEVAQKVLSNLPANPTAEQIAQEINNELSTNKTFAPAEYTTPIIIILVAVVAALAIGLVNLYLVRKRK
jgi:outer membrane protein assembly factor BamB